MPRFAGFFRPLVLDVGPYSDLPPILLALPPWSVDREIPWAEVLDVEPPPMTLAQKAAFRAKLRPYVKPVQQQPREGHHRVMARASLERPTETEQPGDLRLGPYIIRTWEHAETLRWWWSLLLTGVDEFDIERVLQLEAGRALSRQDGQLRGRACLHAHLAAARDALAELALVEVH